MKNIQLSNIDDYFKVDGLSLTNLFFAKYGVFPNSFMFSQSEAQKSSWEFNVDKAIAALKEKYSDDDMKIVIYSTKNLSDNKVRKAACVVIEKERILARIDADVTESYVLYDFDYEKYLEDFVKLISSSYEIINHKTNTLYTVSYSSFGGYDLIESKIKPIENFNIHNLYNDDFIYEDQVIRDFIKEDNKSGIVILHGEKGTGKTSYIRNLIATNPEKKFIFVPSGIVKLLGQPEFASFLMGLSNSVIILEDCENVLKDRMSLDSDDSAVSLILNISDGLLSDMLSIKFICTFNTNLKNIDNALLRKGRLISKHEFKPLKVDKVKRLLALYNIEHDEKLNIDYINEEMTLADIFNITKKAYDIKNKKFL